ncbi:2-dehydropantoate 2-reductase PanG [soil metagenome]
MGQVPARILIIGDGRLATTLWDVLHAPDFPLARSTESSRWTRDSETSLNDVLAKFDASHVWLAISDRALREFTHEHHPVLKDRTVVHFAGSLAGWPGVHAAHPLTTLNGSGAHTYSWFTKIPFVLDLDGPELATLLPGFENATYRLDPSQRAYYHALCATAGNFSVMLWESVATRFERDLALPSEILSVFRRQIFQNLDESDGASVLTGPLLRNDLETMKSHRTAFLSLFEIPLLKIYDAFTDLFRTERARRENHT